MLASLLSGGLVGLLGSIFTNVTDLFKKRQEHKQELALRKLDIEMMDKEYQYQQRSAELEADTRLQESADDLVSASYEHDQRSYSKGFTPSIVGRFFLVLVDVIRALIRPVLTGFLIWQVHATRLEVQEVLSRAGIAGINLVEALAIYKEVIQMTLFLASVAITWWFGTRPPKQGKKV